MHKLAVYIAQTYKLILISFIAQPDNTPALASHLPGVPMSSKMMLNPTMDNFGYIGISTLVQCSLPGVPDVKA